MRTFIFGILIAVTITSLSEGYNLPSDPRQHCSLPDPVTSYRSSIYPLLVSSHKLVSHYSKLQFVFSPPSIWITLAAIAEGSDEETQQKLFKELNLPNDPCIRQMFYKIAATRAIPDNDIAFDHTRVLFVDEGVTVNPAWHGFVLTNSFLNVVTAPLKRNPVAALNEIKRQMNMNVQNLDLSGNSVLVDAIDYNQILKTAFAGAVIEESPFYDQEGKQIGTVDLMKVRRRARMGYIKSANAKILELPIGNHYRIAFLLLLDKVPLSHIVRNFKDDILFEIKGSLRDSNVPIDIGIPRMNMTTEINVRTILEDLGVTKLWSDPEATKYLSSPSALPSSYVQQTIINLDGQGEAVPQFEQDAHPGTPTGLDPAVGTDLVANQPFLFGLFDAETYTPLLAVAYTQPTYQ